MENQENSSMNASNAAPKSATSKKKAPFREVLPKKGLIFHESEAQAVLCKPKLLPLKSFTLEKLEKMQKEATAKAQETILEKQRENESQFYPGSNSDINESTTLNHQEETSHQTESVSFE